MTRHTTVGARILAGSSSQVLQLAEEVALTHHERWDGTGYPRGLAGEDIPLSGRLVAVADVFDALTHTRPYKEAWPLYDAVAEIADLAGRHLDPDLAAVFAELDHPSLLAPIARGRPRTDAAHAGGAAPAGRASPAGAPDRGF
jgi:putative two-component system response regulator